MAASVLDVLRQEEADLEARLKAVRNAIQTLSPVYASAHISGVGSVTPNATVVQADNRATRILGNVREVRRERQGSMAARVAHFALDLFTTTGKRHNSGQILELLTQHNISIYAPKPQSVVSSILSHDPRFDNGADRHGTGYGLRVWAEELVSATTPEQQSMTESPAAASEETAA